MEMMPYQAHLADAPAPVESVASVAAACESIEVVSRPVPPVMTVPNTEAAPAWQAGLPVLQGLRLTLRELEAGDAATLFAELTTEEVTRFISPPPTSVEGFSKFIEWAHRRRSQGRYVCYAVVPEGQTAAVGMFQIHLGDAQSGTAEWGFVLGAGYWGRGLFLEGALLVLDFAFATLGLQRLEARACVANGRGTGALRKIGAVSARLLRGAFEKDGRRLDQRLWVVTPASWRGLVTPKSLVRH